jgi:hypothetical protein
LSEADKDRIAELVHRVRAQYEAGDPELWKGGHPEQRFADVLADTLGPEEFRYAKVLIEQDVARLKEREPDRVLAKVDALSAAIEVRERLERGEIDQAEAQRQVREIDRASGGLISEDWDI